MKIGLLSDTHGYLDEAVIKHFSKVDEVWHAGDIGTVDVSEQLESFRPLKAVWGNIDGKDLRLRHPKTQIFDAEGIKVVMIHIGGYPGRYPPEVRELIRREKPDLFICGHSHILKVMRDHQYGGMLMMNPGACGRHGIHKIRTCLRFQIVSGVISGLEVIELGNRSALS